MLKNKQQTKLVPLRKLLDGTERANKSDSWDYTGGHLNHNHLFKPHILEEKVFWKSARKAPHLQPNKDKDQRLPSQSHTKIKELFALNTDDPKRKSLCEISQDTKQTGPATPKNTPFSSLVLETQSQGRCMENLEHTHHKETSQIEELQQPELKPPTFPCKRNRTSQNYLEKYQFVPSYFTGLTKSDQFNMFLQFDREILQKQFLTKEFYKNVSVEYYEKNLAKGLLNIDHIRPPHFVHLEIFSEIFRNICNESSLFGNILRQIKSAYELYIDYLLDTQSSIQHEVLRSEIVGMKKRPVKSEDVDEAMKTVRKLEQKALIALEHNDQLRNSLKNKSTNTSINDTDTNKELLLHSPEKEPSKDSYCINEKDVFVLKRREVLATSLEVSALEQEIRNNMTHALNAETTEQYIKDVKTETVKLQSSNAFLQSANKDLDTEIKRLLMKQKLTLDKQEELKNLMESFLKTEDL
ncbi:uncharacterized protein C6orf118 homolog [Pseudophryne corroboree]|uniref:uncharacterized protein C6orf118 homolog n=1 Tax=Pseudophryne corroboree TaxID=495146 RepID=UPI00308193F8